MFKKIFFLIVTSAFLNIHLVNAQIVADFEDLTPGGAGYWNGSDGSGGFQSGACSFNNSYDSTWGSWMGWAYSTLYDTVTAGFGNQYSAFAEPLPGVNGQFGLSYGQKNGFTLTTSGSPGYLDSLSVANSTYTALSMRDGDSFAKKFGGTTGNDPDFFKIVFRGFLQGSLKDSLEFFLADYRFSNNSQDYILKGFHTVQLTHFGLIDSLEFELFSSDTSGQWMNTPAYVCMDNITAMMPTSISDRLSPDNFTVFPNPAATQIFWNPTETGPIELYDSQGKLVRSEQLLSAKIDISSLPSGIYILKKISATGILTKRLLIQR